MGQVGVEAVGDDRAEDDDGRQRLTGLEHVRVLADHIKVDALAGLGLVIDLRHSRTRFAPEWDRRGRFAGESLDGPKSAAVDQQRPPLAGPALLGLGCNRVRLR